MRYNHMTKLEERIIERGITVSQIIEESGISRATLYSLLNHTTKKPHLGVIGKLARYLDISPVELLVQYREDKQQQDETK